MGESCEHGTAWDVHCCNCHSGFIFDMKHECPAPVRAEEPTDRQRAKCCACGETEAGYMAEELDGVYCKHCWDDLRDFFQREAALPPVQEPRTVKQALEDAAEIVGRAPTNDEVPVQESPTPEPWGPFREFCRSCNTRTHCDHHNRCLAECTPADVASSPSHGARLDDLKALVADAAITCESAPGDRRVVICFGDNLERAQALFTLLSGEKR